MKIFFRRIHLYLGLAAGLVIMVTCFTGAILVFEKELQRLFHKDRYFVTVKDSRLSTDSLVNIVAKGVPKAKIAGILFHADPTRSAEVSFNTKAIKKPGEKTETVKAKGGEGIKIVAFIDPYSGKVLEYYNHRDSFFYVVMDLHRWMLGGDTGKLVVGICTLVFLLILITGIILWWPKNRAILKQRLRIKKNAGFKRLNHDYHIVFGFYSAIFLFVFAFTGLAWSFEWFNKGIYLVTNSSMQKTPPPKSSMQNAPVKIPFEQALQSVIAKNNNARFYNISLPKDSADAIAITLLPADAKHESATDTYFIDAWSGKLQGLQTFASKNKGQRVRATFKPVHVASIYGLPSKIIGFLACLLGTFFPLTGIIMWINRTWKKKATTDVRV